MAGPGTSVAQATLPAEVVERLDHAGLSVAVRDSRQDSRALRLTAAPVEARQSDDGATLTLRGYATSWDTPYDVAGGAPFGWVETVAAGSFDRSLRERDDVRLLVNHDADTAAGVPLARTRSRTLELTADSLGLLVVAELDARRTVVADLRSALDRGDIDEMSISFQVLRQEWNADYTTRTIKEARLFDVSVVTFPANPATIVQTESDSATPVAARAGGYPAGLAAAIAEVTRSRSRIV